MERGRGGHCTVLYCTVLYTVQDGGYLVEDAEAGVPGEDGHGLPVRDAQEREPVDLVQLVTELQHTSVKTFAKFR